MPPQAQIEQAQGKLQQADADLRTAQTAPKTMQVIRSRALAAQANADRRKAELDQALLNLRLHQGRSLLSPESSATAPSKSARIYKPARR